MESSELLFEDSIFVIAGIKNQIVKDFWRAGWSGGKQSDAGNP